MTEAKQVFENALVDAENLMWFHEEFGGADPGKRAAYFQSLSKSAIILLCSAWESYVETIILEIVDLQISLAKEALHLPLNLQSISTVHIKAMKDDRAWLKVAGEGWRKIAREACLANLGRLHSPHTKAVSDQFNTILGVEKISEAWSWKAARNIGGRIDNLVKLRGDLAHAKSSQMSVQKLIVTQNINLIRRVVDCTDAYLVAEGFFTNPPPTARRALAAGPGRSRMRPGVS